MKESNFFVGIVDKSNYKKDKLNSTHWKDSLNSFYWEVHNNKLIWINKEGTIKTKMGYGCNCNKVDRIGILYDEKEQTISFFKNKINQGVAFTSVDKGYFPALDLWFDKGKVEISDAVNEEHDLAI